MTRIDFQRDGVVESMNHRQSSQGTNGPKGAYSQRGAGRDLSDPAIDFREVEEVKKDQGPSHSR